MIHREQVMRLTGAALLLCLGACASGNNPAQSTGDPTATAPAATSDPGSRYLDPSAEPIGGLTVETPPVDGAWADGQTSIARPAPGSTPAGSMPSGRAAAGSPDGGPAPASGSLPAPVGGPLPAPSQRRTPLPPPPPPLR